MKVDGDKEVKAKFIKVHKLTLTPTVHGTLEAAPAEEHYDADTEVSLTATADEGYEVDVWSDVDSSVAATAKVRMNDARTVGVTFKKRKYALTIDAPENGAIEGADNDSQHEHGTEVTLTAVPDEGYELDAWAGVSSHDGLTAKVTMTQARTASVSFKKRKYALTINERENGAIQGADSGSQHEHGTEVTLTAVPDEGCELNAWAGVSSHDGLTAKVTMTQARTASVSFKAQVRAHHQRASRTAPSRAPTAVRSTSTAPRSPSPPSPTRAMSSTRGPASPPMTA